MNKNFEYLSWEDYFMSVAFLSGMRSKDPSSQVGACIVNADNIIVSIGYNGMPRGCSDDELPWAKEAANKLDTKYMYVCHAEMNAVVNKNSADVAGCRMYVVLFPCNECAKIIIQSRVKEIIYYSDKHNNKPETIASKKMLDMVGIKYRHFSPKYSKIEINFKYENSSSGDCLLLKNDNICHLDEDHLEALAISENINRKRAGYLAWEDYFMALAFLSSKRSKDPLAQFGACIVNNENKIVGIGYNGVPRGCDETKLFGTEASTNHVNHKHMFVCHAEMNAVLNKNCSKISGCKMYVLTFPCNECAKFLIQEEIMELIFYSDKEMETPEALASKIMFDMAGVRYRKYEGKLEKIAINFDCINWNKMQLPPDSQTS